MKVHYCFCALCELGFIDFSRSPLRSAIEKRLLAGGVFIGWNTSYCGRRWGLILRLQVFLKMDWCQLLSKDLHKRQTRADCTFGLLFSRYPKSQVQLMVQIAPKQHYSTGGSRNSSAECAGVSQQLLEPFFPSAPSWGWMNDRTVLSTSGTTILYYQAIPVLSEILMSQLSWGRAVRHRSGSLISRRDVQPVDGSPPSSDDQESKYSLPSRGRRWS